MRSVKEWAAYLDTVDLPVLRRTAEALGRLAKTADKVTSADLAQVILHDPMLTLRVLRLANRPRSARFENEVTMVEHAVVVIGVTPLFQQFSRLSVLEDLLQTKERALEDIHCALSQAFHAAYLARDWAILRMDMQAEELYVAALLHDFAHLVMGCVAPGDMQKVQRLRRKERISAEEAETRVFGFPLCRLQDELALAWRIPELTLSLMDPRNVERPRSRLVLVAAEVVRHAAKGWYNEALEQDYAAVAEMLRISPDDAAALVHVDCAVSARGWKRYGVPPLAAWLPMLPGEWPEEPEEEEKPHSAARPASGETHPHPHLVARPETLKRSMADIAAHCNGTLNLHDMMSLVMRGMHEGIGLDRVVFALMLPDRSAVKVKYVIGAEPSSPLRQFGFSMQTANLFARLMSQVQGIWVNDGNRAQLGTFVDEEIHAMTEGQDFFAMSIYVRNKPVGLFYADKKDSEESLSEKAYQEFKSLALQAAQGLGHLARKA